MATADLDDVKLLEKILRLAQEKGLNVNHVKELLKNNQTLLAQLKDVVKGNHPIEAETNRQLLGLINPYVAGSLTNVVQGNPHGNPSGIADVNVNNGDALLDAQNRTSAIHTPLRMKPTPPGTLK